MFERDRSILAALALDVRLPTVCQWANMAQAGCLLGYDPSRPTMRQRAANLVARIFRDALPRDLPIEPATNFEFVISLKTA